MPRSSLAARFGVLFGAAALLTLAAIPVTRASDAITSAEAAGVLAEIGVTPEAIAIAGLAASDAETMIARVQAAESLRLQLRSAGAAVAADGAALTSAASRRFHAVEGVTAGNVSTAASNAAESAANRAFAADNLFSAATVGFPQGAVALLSACRAGPASGLPPEFWPLRCDAEQTLALREALVAERRAARRGEQLPVEIAGLLDQYRSDERVVDAMAALERVANIAAAFE